MNLKNYSVIFLLIISLIFVSCKSNNKTPQENQKPNIVLIIADDVSWDDIGAYGHPKVKTPHLDQLAKEGMIFNQAFLTTSSCSPSRTSIVSGLYPHNTDAEQLSWPLPDYKKTFVQELKNAGYWTGLAGKYHMGDPVRDDFDSLLEMQWKDAPIGLDRRLVGDGSGCDEWIKLLQERPKDKPFFTWLASFDAHRPFYEGMSKDPYNPEETIIPPYMPVTQASKKDFALYYDEISRMDDYIGKVVAELEVQGVAENTVVLFISDNGRAFPRDKTTLYDGGIKTPWIVKWPAKIEPNSVNNNLVSSVDIAPTFMTMAGLEPLTDFDGVDLLSTLINTKISVRDDVYAEDHFHDFEDYTRAVRTTKYKYIKNYYPDLPNTPSADIIRDLTWKSMKEERDKGTLTEAQMRCFEIPRPNEELYDIEKDPYELNNLALNQDYDYVLNDMRIRLKRMRESTNDYLPTERMPDDFVRETGYPTKYRIRPRPSKAVYMKAREEGKVLMNPDFVETISTE
ncbi:sulfatase family protein [Seonamhaeicola maritimus]|uniref:Sulfatase n=1 Tax=Seonamhaeicola maritimus TaxID=2591822 RepID=A0A5C7GFN3_9FLAO|nr:sulfatase [Seonamhaeicola maritimus]TXG35436.1 sulfatase [Seonamhaeicola maritimus]